MTSIASSRPEIHIHVNFFYRYGETSSPSLPNPFLFAARCSAKSGLCRCIHAPDSSAGQWRLPWLIPTFENHPAVPLCCIACSSALAMRTLANPATFQ